MKKNNKLAISSLINKKFTKKSINKKKWVKSKNNIRQTNEKNYIKPDFIRDFNLNYLNYDKNNSKISTLIQYNNFNKQYFSGSKNRKINKKIIKQENNYYFSFVYLFNNFRKVNFNCLENVKYFNLFYKECLEIRKLTKMKPKFKLNSIFIKDIKDNEILFLVDIDETLIFTEKYIAGKFYDFTLKINNNKNTVTSCQNKLGVNIRPYTKEFLEKLNNYGKIAIFTSGSEQYAKKIVKNIVPKNIKIDNIIHKDYVGIVNNQLIKDLRIIKNVKLEKIVLFDNSIKNFTFQNYNGFPVFPFRKQKNDKELLNIINILDIFKKSNNIQLLLKNKIDLFKLINIENHNKLLEHVKNQINQ